MRDGKTYISKEYYENGNLHYIDNYKDGEQIRRRAYDEEGKLRFDQKY